MPVLTSAFRATGFIFFLVVASAAQAQFKRAVLETSAPTTLIGTEDIQRTIRVNNFTEILRYTPDMVLKERTSRVDIPGRIRR